MTGVPSSAEPLQQRIRDRVLSEVSETAVALFVANGFDETTVDQICEAAGLSRRSFFRYFKGKEDVVVSLFSTFAVEGCAHFVARPAGEDVWTALRHSMTPMTRWADDDPVRAVAMLRLIDDSPSLRARYLDRVDRWRASLADVVHARQASATHLQAAVIAAAGMGAYLAAVRAWVATDGADSLPTLFDAAFAALRPRMD
ncbi:acyl-CoA-like ligand-binding transcription factor [Williamsia phyllosphaerae]|uniref:acyl-CoA-like ligand-binding transcription factor n=1 Tax=Williamsia phyllosphaerae TaxID=885042 RepID=UPI00166505A5|nr:TetR family transcriptional regulator [Williamsia phyllosphaerae]